VCERCGVNQRLVISGEIHAENVGLLGGALEQAEGRGPWDLDLARVTAIDFTALDVLVEAKKKGQFQLVAVSVPVRRILWRTDTEHLLT
jgi:anti-anti-sigma regulatory factor